MKRKTTSAILAGGDVVRRAMNQGRSKPTVLVVTTELDPHADAVMDELDAMDCECFRFHPEALMTNFSLSMSLGDDGWSIEVSDAHGRQIRLPGAGVAGYLRKPKSVEARTELKDPLGRRFAENEGREVVRTLLRLPGIAWLPDPQAVRWGSAKALQLAAAARAGLETPHTVITTVPDVAERFVRRHQEGVVCKRVGTAPVDLDGRHLVLYTATVDLDELDLLREGVVQAPTLLQELVPKRAELRIVIVGEDMFAFEIDSQSNERARLDWRAVDPFDLPHRAVQLPDFVRVGLQRFVAGYGLEFSVVDMAITPDDHYVFFENNPNGQWYWLELMTGVPLARAVANALVRRARAAELGSQSVARMSQTV